MSHMVVKRVCFMLKNNSEQFDLIIANFASVSDSLAQADIKKTIETTNQVLAQFNAIMEKVAKGEGTLGALLHNDTLYTNIENSTYNLNRLLRDFRENPKRYVNFALVDLGKVPDTEAMRWIENLYA